MCSVLHAEKAVEAFILKGHLAEKEVIVLDIPRIFTMADSTCKCNTLKVE